MKEKACHQMNFTNWFYKYHLPTACRFYSPEEGEGGIWARESAWGARGRKERNACKDAIVFSVFYAQILSVKIVTGQN